MKFALLLTWRELRTAWRRLVFFIICLSIGIATMIFVRSAIQCVNIYTNREARTINGGDVVLRSNTPFDEEQLQKIQSSAGDEILDRTRTVTTATMLRPMGDDQSIAKMVEVKGVEPNYPLYGNLALSEGEVYDFGLLADGGILINPTLASQLNLSVGDRVNLGAGSFNVRGLIENEPGSGIGAFSFGPRVLISLDALDRAGLGAGMIRTRNTLLFKVDESHYESTVKSLKEVFKGDHLLVRGYKDAEEGMNDQLSKAANYMSLVGLAILVLGGVGIWSVTRVYIQQRWKSIAILKCLGCSTRKAVLSYTLQVMAIGVLGSIFGAILAWICLRLLSDYLAGGPLSVVDVGVTWQALVQGIGVGILVALLFSIVPLLGIRDIKPSLVLRSADPTGQRRWTISRFALGIALLGGLFLISTWQAGSWIVGAFFWGGLLATGLLSLLSAELVIFVVRRLKRIPVFSIRYAIQGLQRPGNQTRAILISLGLGVFFLVGTADVERTLLNMLDSRLSAELPDMFLVDIQQDQKDQIQTVLTEIAHARPTILPTIRARIKAINYEEIDLEGVEDRRRRSRLGQEYTLTTRQDLEETETIVEGAWWTASDTPNAEVSVEQELEESLGLEIGDVLTFDIQGQTVDTTITSFRRIDWENSRTGFMFVVEPGGLDAIQMVYVGAVKGPEDQMLRGRIAREISDRFSNVSIIDVREIIATVTRILSSITTAITVIGLIVLLTGGLILIGSVTMSRYVREFETALLRTLGATSGLITGLTAAEYAVLGGLAGAVGATMGILFSRLLTIYVFELEWSFDPALLLYSIAGTAVLVTVVGIVSNVSLMFLKPLGVLKREENI